MRLYGFWLIGFFGFAFGAFLQSLAEVRHRGAQLAANPRYAADSEEQDYNDKNDKQFGWSQIRHNGSISLALRIQRHYNTLCQNIESSLILGC